MLLIVWSSSQRACQDHEPAALLLLSERILSAPGSDPAGSDPEQLSWSAIIQGQRTGRDSFSQSMISQALHRQGDRCDEPQAARVGAIHADIGRADLG
jgi:hypothetical protein